MPDWLTDALKAAVTQYPIAVVIGLVAWYVVKQLRLGHIEQRKRDDEHHAARLAEMKANTDAALSAKNAEIKRLGKTYMAELRKLTKAIAAVESSVKTLSEPEASP